MKQTTITSRVQTTSVANASYCGEVPPSGYRGEVPESGYRGEVPESGYRGEVPESGYRKDTSVSAARKIKYVPNTDYLPTLLIKVKSKLTGNPIQNCKVIFKGSGWLTFHTAREQITNSDGEVNYCIPPGIYWLSVLVNDVVVIPEDRCEKFSGECIVSI